MLKLLLTPLLIVVATLVGRRWGPTVSGWLIGLPLTSGPVMLFLALSHGPAFASAASAGTLSGTISECAFCLTFGWVSLRSRWPVALAASTLAFVLATAGLGFVLLPIGPLFAIVMLALVASLLLMPPVSPRSLTMSPANPKWDLPARALLATAFVVTLTALASALGPRLTGLVAPFPVYASILATFALRQVGSGGAVFVVRGLLIGLFGFATFFLALALALPLVDVATSFSIATTAALLVQGSSFMLVRHRHTRAAGI